MNKQVITFSANEQSLIKTGGINNYASNIVSYVEAHFDLGANWQGYDSIRAIWHTQYTDVATVLDTDGICIVPAEVLNTKAKLTVNLVGSISENDVLTDRLTTYPIEALIVDADARITAGASQPITPSEYEQFVASVKADADRAETAKDSARVYAGNALSSAQNALVSETNASTSETNAHTSEVNAKASELNAETYKDQAQTYAQNADVSATNAENAKDEAIDARDEILGMSATATTLPAGSSATASYSDGVLSLGIPKGDKGDKGNTGETGAPAGFGTVSATVDDTIGTPSVEVTASGADTAKNFAFAFHNLKGQKGDKGDTGDVSQAQLDATVSDLKSDLNEVDSALSNIATIKHKVNYISGHLIYVGNDIGTTTNITPQTDASWEYAIVSCNEGDTIEVKAKGAAGARAWAFLDSENKLLSRSVSGVIEAVITAPQNATKCVLNNKKSEYTNETYTFVGENAFLKMEQLVDESLDYVIQNVDLARGFYSYSGSPSHKTYTALDYYESASINCKEGEQYKLSGYVLDSSTAIGYFWDENDNLISSIGTSAVNEYADKEITIPDGCVNFTVTSYRNENHTHTIIKKLLIVGAESEKEKHPLIGKKFLSFGDSITAFAPRWRDEFLRQTGAEEIHCYAVGGATLVDWEDTVLDGNIEDGAQNTVCNQVAQFLLDPPETIPDFVIISAGTNDSWSADDLSRTTNTQFVDASHQWISLDDVDRTRPDGAMRWQAEKIWSVYPNTVIIFGAPIQCAESIHTYHLQEQKNNRMKIVGNQLSCKVIMGAYDSGIYGRYETANVNGKYLADGIHPNTDGGIVLGKLYAREICNLLKF